MASVVAFSPVRVDPETLRAHLLGLAWQGGDLAAHWHCDDNTDPESSELLWAEDEPLIWRPEDTLPPGDGYVRGADTHSWSAAAVARVARIKDGAIRQFLATGHTHLLLLDADLVLRPSTVAHMVAADLPILCQVFWTRWKAEGTEDSPNVWDYHPTGYYHRESFERLRQPGHYEVGGLGACTLIRRDVLEAGVSFAPVAGVDYFGEDRHFCIRAAARDIPLTACSHLPPYHVYRERDLLGLDAWMSEVGP